MDLTQQWQAPPSSVARGMQARVEYRLGGAHLEIDAVDCDEVPFEHAEPVRSFPSWRLKRHYDGHHWMRSLGVSIGFESLTERACLIELDRTPGVIAAASQPMWIHWDAHDRRRDHCPDYFVRLDGGAAVLIDVKPATQIDGDVRQQFDMTASFAADRGWSYVVYDGESRARQANLRFLTVFGDRGAVGDLPSLPEGGLPLAKVAALLGNGSDGYARCYAHLWSGRYEADLDRPLSARTVVRERSR